MNLSNALRIQTVIQWLAVALLVALPFRATVDKRGGILVLLVILIAFSSIRNGAWRQFVPTSRALGITALVWLGASLAWALAGANVFEGLRSVRSDVLGPILAFCVFHGLTRNQDDLLRWAMAASIAQLVVAVLAVADPYQPGTAHRPAYIDVGVLSAWLVLVSALLPVLWWAPSKYRRQARTYAALVAFSIGMAGLASANRTVWLCWSAMLLAGTIAAKWHERSQAVTPSNRRDWLWVGAGLGLLIALAWVSVLWRAPSYNATPGQTSAYVLNDPRIVLWRAGAELAAERPLTGHGLVSREWRDELARRTAPETAPDVFDHAHNTILNLGIKMGLTGMAIVVALFTVLGHAFVCAMKGKGGAARLASACGVMLVAGYFVRNLTDDFFLRQPLLFFAAVAGMLLGAARSPDPVIPASCETPPSSFPQA